MTLPTISFVIASIFYLALKLFFIPEREILFPFLGETNGARRRTKAPAIPL